LNDLEKEVGDDSEESMRGLPHAHVTLKPPPRPPRRYSQSINQSIYLSIYLSIYQSINVMIKHLTSFFCSRVVKPTGDALLDEMEDMMQTMEHGQPSRSEAAKKKGDGGLRLSEDDIQFHSHGRLGGSHLAQSLEKKRKKRLLVDTEKRLIDV
jgi:hypothetical protein